MILHNANQAHCDHVFELVAELKQSQVCGHLSCGLCANRWFDMEDLLCCLSLHSIATYYLNCQLLLIHALTPILQPSPSSSFSTALDHYTHLLTIFETKIIPPSCSIATKVSIPPDPVTTTDEHWLLVLTSPEHGVATIWLVATLGSRSITRRFNRKAIFDVDVPGACRVIVNPDAPMALRLQGNLLLVPGVFCFPFVARPDD